MPRDSSKSSSTTRSTRSTSNSTGSSGTLDPSDTGRTRVGASDTAALGSDARGSDANERLEERAEENFLELLGAFDDAMLVTHDAGGAMHARPMSIARVEPDGDLWFFTSIDSAKVEELTRSSRALVVLQATHKFATVNGHAEVVRDRAKIEALWSDKLRIYWKGPSDPSIALIHVRAEAGEYWDDSGLAGIKFALRAAAALLTGEPLASRAGPSATHAGGAQRPNEHDQHRDPSDDPLASDVALHGNVKLK